MRSSPSAQTAVTMSFAVEPTRTRRQTGHRDVLFHCRSIPGYASPDARLGSVIYDGDKRYRTASHNPRPRGSVARVVVRRFVPEISLLVVGIAILSTGAALLTTTGASHALGAALTVIGAAGVSISGVAARLKDAASNLLQQLRNQLYEAAVAEVTCFAPPSPKIPHLPTSAPATPGNLGPATPRART